jgi:hypothetical protein
MWSRIRIALLLVVAVAVAAPLALAATKNGITPLAPQAGSTVAVGSRPTFKVRVKGPGQVWVQVCKSPRRDKDGVICNKELIAQAHKRGGVFQVKARLFNYPQYWLNSPGTYYWQAHRIFCNGTSSDCLQEGPVVRFKVG